MYEYTRRHELPRGRYDPAARTAAPGVGLASTSGPQETGGGRGYSAGAGAAGCGGSTGQLHRPGDLVTQAMRIGATPGLYERKGAGGQCRKFP